MTVEELMDEFVARVQHLSQLSEAGTLTHAEWRASLDEFNKKLDGLPEDERDILNMEAFHIIEPGQH